MSDRRVELAKRAKDAQEALAAEVKRVQDDCTHPFAALEITQGAVTSYSGGATSHELFVRCKTCSAFFSRWVKFHND